MSKRVLCLLAPGFEEIETVTPVDLLRRAGIEVILASIDGSDFVTGRCGMVLKADATFEEAAEATYHLLLIPGGPGVKQLREDGRASTLAAAYAEGDKLVATICAGPLILADAGLIDNRRFTAHFSLQNELPDALFSEKVVEDGNIITSRGAGAAMEFSLALVARLAGQTKADEIAQGIMWS
jgi:4-methyl-5(b-hydroxyethyl)-thiazole monophosphate biosynthesis